MITTALLAGCLAAAQPTSAAALQLGDPQAIVALDKHGQLHLAKGQLGFLGARPEQVRAFVHERALPLNLRQDEFLELHDDAVDMLGNRHIHATRTVHGVPVAFDEIRIHAAASGLVYAMESELSPLQDFTYRAPSLTPWQAIKTAEGGFKGKLLEPTHAELVIVGESLDGVRGAHLAYKVHVAFPAKPGKLPIIEDEYLDANTGAVLAHLSRVYSDGTPDTMSISDLNGGTQSVNVDNISGQGVLLKDLVTLPNGAVYTIDNSNNGSIYATSDTSTPFADGASMAGEPGSIASNVNITLGFYNTQFGWQRWDFGQTPAGAGGLVAGIAHEGQNLANAYFVSLTSNGQVFGTMHYGDGDGQSITNTAKCLDVTGHEMGHGVVQGTAGLVYHNQSGALNESYADVFGWMLKNQNGQTNDYIGDQCVGPQLAPALRDMCNPGSVPIPQPGDMAHYQQLADTDDQDHGGVHTNSGIPNHAACLFRNAEQGFGHLGAIWFKTLHDHLGSTASFQDMVNGTVTSCGELQYAQSECDALVSAWQQVGLAAATGTGGSCPANSTASGSGCVCNSGFQPDASGNCVAVAQNTCPDHAHVDPGSGSCYCDDGYDVSSDGQTCEPLSTGGCGDHSHQEGGSCVCDTCYVFGGSAGNETGACVQDPSCNPSCNDPGSTNDATCSCLPGLSKDANGKCTVSAPGGGCGSETFAGRCDGNTLIYCYTAQNQLEVIDCTTDPYTNGDTACGADTTNGGYNCVAPVSNCGTVPATGQCNGTSASYCSDGTTQTIDCAGSACITFQFSGYTYNFCNPCDAGKIPSADGTPDSSGNVVCVPGTASTGSTTAGTSGATTAGTTSGSSGTSGTTGDSSGCSSAGNGDSMALIFGAIAFAITLARRKR